jgi:hypothetical protein
MRIRGNQVASAEADYISRDHVAPGKLFPLAIAQDGCRGSNLRAQFFDGLLRPITLGQVNRSTEQDNDPDDRRIHSIAGECRHGCGNHEDQYQRIRERMPEIGEEGVVLGCRRLIGPELAEPCLSFLRREASSRDAGLVGVGRHGSVYLDNALFRSRPIIEQNQSFRADGNRVQDGLFLRKKPLNCVGSFLHQL